MICLLNIIFYGLFNTLYKYCTVENNLAYYYDNTSFISSYMTKSSVDVPYLKIFVLSVITSLVIYFIMSLLLKFKNKSTFKQEIKKLNNLIFTMSLLISTLTLLASTLVGVILLVVSFIFYFISLYKRFDQKSFIMIIIFNLLLITLLYMITA